MAESASTTKVAAVVAFYMVAALVMVFVNKAVLNKTPDLTMSFLFIQLVIAVVLLHMASWFSNTRAGSFLSGKVVLPDLDLDIARKLAPVTIIAVVGLVFNTLCLRDVDASFFQIARGLVLPLTITVSSMYTRSRPSATTVVAAGIVTVGFFIGVSPSSSAVAFQTISLLPLFYGFLASLMIAVHAVLVKSAHGHVGNSSIKLAYWTNLGSAIMLVPFMWFNGEVAALTNLWLAGGESFRVFVVGSAITGVFGFALCMAGLLSIKVTSPVTHMFSSAARSVIQTVLAVLLFGDTITTNRGLSIIVITVGTLFFTWIKSSGPPLPAPVKVKSPVEHDIEKGETKA